MNYLENYDGKKLRDARCKLGFEINEVNEILAESLPNIDVKKFENNEEPIPVDWIVLIMNQYRAMNNDRPEEDQINSRVFSPMSVALPHDKVRKYEDSIYANSIYEGLVKADLNARGKKDISDITWVTTGKSKIGEARKKWWDSQKFDNDCSTSQTCLRIHPTKHKPCYVCGTDKYIDYRYPNKNSLSKLNVLFDSEYILGGLSILEIIDDLVLNDVDSNLIISGVKSVFAIANQNIDNIESLKKCLTEDYIENFSDKLSPGAMSNPPDRFDGFHSYNICCRSKFDTGRHQENLSTYGEDRRAYENWADGDWKTASWLMKVFNRHGFSADHIGPISLGFCHRPKFQAMTAAENSTKGNRMSLEDVAQLIEDENNGESVISWHSKSLWDSLKSQVKTNDDSKKLSSLMRTNMHYVLTFFCEINELDLGREFLKSMIDKQKKYSYFYIEFSNFDPKNGTCEFNKTRGKKKQYENHANRLERIAFESLEKYKNKKNRNSNYHIDNNFINASISELKKQTSIEDFQKKVHEILKKLSEKLIQDNWLMP